MRYFTIILPVYNDWDCLQILLGQIEDSLKGTDANFELLLINDGSNNFSDLNFNKKKFFNKIRIINLRKNVGSQKAIATALKYISNNNEKFKRDFIIMDSDGEDDPNKIQLILDLLKQNNRIKLITLNRTIRKESFFFSILYELHLFITFLFTFNYIRFGNFSYINMDVINKISKKRELWFAYSAAINKFFKKKISVIAPRKNRITGQSKMSYVNLFKHSISIQSVFKKNIYLSYLLFLSMGLISLMSGMSEILFIGLLILLTLHYIILNFLKLNQSEISFDKCLDNIVSIDQK